MRGVFWIERWCCCGSSLGRSKIMYPLASEVTGLSDFRSSTVGAGSHRGRPVLTSPIYVSRPRSRRERVTTRRDGCTRGGCSRELRARARLLPRGRCASRSRRAAGSARGTGGGSCSRMAARRARASVEGRRRPARSLSRWDPRGECTSWRAWGHHPKGCQGSISVRVPERAGSRGTLDAESRTGAVLERTCANRGNRREW